MIIGVAIDKWKLPIFKRLLKKEGYEFTKHPGVSANTFLLKIVAPTIAELAPTIANANQEARLSV